MLFSVGRFLSILGISSYALHFDAERLSFSHDFVFMQIIN